MSHSVRPHRRQPTRLPCPWGSPGKSTSRLPFPSPMHGSEKWKWNRSVVSDSVRPHRRQPTRPPGPWDSPGKNTGVGCHFLLQCMEVKSEREAAQLCPTPSDSMDWSLPGSSIHGIFQARVLEWVAMCNARCLLSSVGWNILISSSSGCGYLTTYHGSAKLFNV